MSRINGISRVALAAAGVGAAIMSPAVSYSAAQPNLQQAIDEVLVTARRREESLQEVPIAISALGGEELAEKGVESVQNMNSVVPNLMVMGGVNTADSAGTFRVRGMPGVSVYIDGVNQATTDGLITTSVVEVDRIEVLRGPQGTLFGNTSLGGAVHYVTRAPADVFGARIQATIGSFNRRDVQAAFDIPISDTLKTKFTAASQFRKGYVHSTTSSKDFGDINDELYRADFLWTPVDSLRVRYNLDYSTTDRIGPGRILFEMAEPGLNTVPVQGVFKQLSSFAPYHIYQAFGYNYTPATHVSGYPGGATGEYETLLNTTRNGFVGETTRHTLDITWEINDAFSVRSISGYKDLMRFTDTDLDGSSVVSYNNRETSAKNFTFGQELQLLGTHERVDWVLGAFYQQEYNRSRSSLRSLPEFTCDLWANAFKPDRRISIADEAMCYNNRARALGVSDPTRVANASMTRAQIAALAGQLATQFANTAGGQVYNGLTISPFSSAAAQNSDGMTIGKPETRAVFGDITFRVTDQLSVAAGLRYSEDISNGTIRVGTPALRTNLVSHAGLLLNEDIPNYFAFNGPLPTPTNSQEFDALTKRLTVQYQWTPDLMTYITYSDGYGPGGQADLTQSAQAWLQLNADRTVATGGALRDVYNGLIPGAVMDMPDLLIRGEETVKNFEVGMRADWFGGALRTNVTAFFTEWKNYNASTYIATKYWDTDGDGQFDTPLDINNDGIVGGIEDLNRFPGLLGTAADLAEVKGLEIESNWRVTDALRVSLNLGFLDTKFKELGAAGVGVAPAIDEDTKFAYAPEMTANLGIQYEIPFSGGAALLPRLDYTYTDDYTLTPNNENQRPQDGFSLLNARLTYDSGANWRLSLTGSNLTDEYYLNSGFYSAADKQFFTTPGRPREWGLVFNLNFN